MGAYNDLLIEERCPACGRQSTIVCQLHVGASYGGDGLGRFALRQYQIGQRLLWWPQGHWRHESWREEAERTNADNSVDECSYASCTSCHADLFVGVRFRDVTPVEILGIALKPPSWCMQ